VTQSIIQYALIQPAYLGASALFFLAIREMSNPRQARRATKYAIGAMLLSVAVTLFSPNTDPAWIVMGFMGGAVLTYANLSQGISLPIPQVVVLLTGLGGLSTILAVAIRLAGESQGILTMLGTAIASLSGSLTISGSLVALGKMTKHPWAKNPKLPQQELAVRLLSGFAVLMALWMTVHPNLVTFYYPVVILSLGVGFLGLVSVRKADIPILTVLLNSTAALAAAGAGIAYSCTVMIITGGLIASTNFILTRNLCQQTNRTILDLIHGKKPEETNQATSTSSNEASDQPPTPTPSEPTVDVETDSSQATLSEPPLPTDGQ